jgi:hypothetical protein
VAHIDRHYRTIANRISRGLGGRPDVFSSLYIMSACCLMNTPSPPGSTRGAGPRGDGARGDGAHRDGAIMGEVGTQHGLAANRQMDQILTDFGITHTIETYGDHTNRVERIEQKVLPFFKEPEKVGPAEAGL